MRTKTGHGLTYGDIQCIKRSPIEVVHLLSRLRMSIMLTGQSPAKQQEKSVVQIIVLSTVGCFDQPTETRGRKKG